MTGETERAAAAIEPEIVVAAALIHVDNRDAVLGRHAAQHLFALGVFADRKRRGREVDDRLSASSYQLLNRIVVIAAALPEVSVVPDVFTDRDPKPAAAEVQRLRIVEGFDVSIFVEDVVCREQRLSKSLVNGTVAEERGRVEERPPFLGAVRLRQSYERRRAVGQRRRQLIEGCPA